LVSYGKFGVSAPFCPCTVRCRGSVGIEGKPLSD
jgi:hypothetical protein